LVEFEVRLIICVRETVNGKNNSTIRVRLRNNIDSGELSRIWSIMWVKCKSTQGW